MTEQELLEALQRRTQVALTEANDALDALLEAYRKAETFDSVLDISRLRGFLVLDLDKARKEIAIGLPRAEKPMAPLSGYDGNLFAVLARAAGALKRAGQEERAKEMWRRVTGGETLANSDRIKCAHSYEQALRIILEYVEDGEPLEDDDDSDEEDSE